MKPATFILLADPQIGWQNIPREKLSSLNGALNRISSVEYTNDPSHNINITCSGPIGKPDAVFFAGDLTNYGGNLNWPEWADVEKADASNYEGGELLKEFRALYDPKWAGLAVTPLNESGPLYFGLGNHDISFNNTVDEAWYAPLFVWRDFEGNGMTDYTDYYRYQMWNFINQMHTGFHRDLHGRPVATDPPFPIPANSIDSDPDGTFYYQDHSFNYVVDLGPVDVYQLHLFGGDVAHERRSGLDWLKRKLAARGYTRPVFIVQHLPMGYPDGDYWNDSARDQFLEILRPYNVLGVGVGHDHYQAKIKEIRPSSSTSGVENDQHIYQVQPGPAFERKFGIIRVEESPTEDEIITNILYGNVDSSTSEVVLTAGWNIRTPNMELYVKDIEVIYLDKPADDRSSTLPWYVIEEGGESANINEGFGGTFVYIKPILTDNATDAATGFDLLVQDDAYSGPHAGVRDLADGTDGKRRYLVPKQECDKPPMKQLFLWRSDCQQAPRIGWELTSDINEGRGSPLYLEWETS
ncbi:hypothetical protein K458DRAFT_433881 [Lentithecium fluviatile CBS 122367]|uniref:Calcineurin-like phosphoesterase domain-containing protein n=1 Tax=Lentithecium fluviatile CBS 122367 TaxID=1168545 RepID=A0A6G1IRX2_9PLEO|nr:hypothetical protein K458DRAFT_433881 [Lentithecium fluviatile CBS 122367]